MRITQGTFSALPDLTDDETRAQVQYAVDNGWAVAVEFTDDPHPRNVLWEMWGLPMFGITDAAAAMLEVTSAAWPTPATTSGCRPTTRAWAGRPPRSASS